MGMTTPEDVLEQQPAAIAERAESVGSERLDRGNLDILVTAIIGGAEVSIGGLAAMTVVGAVLKDVPGSELSLALVLAGLAFPIGFLLVIVGRSELFTENFLIPVVAVFKTKRGIGSLVTLWTLAWIGNMIGCAGTAVLLLMPDAVRTVINQG